jgi:predicted TIM-barrel fold metal-dependent hydrolase
LPFAIPLIDIHTHIGRLPGVVGEVFTADDLRYIAEREGARFMLTSSATATTVSQAAGTREAIAMAQQHGDRLGAMLWINPHDPDWRADVALAVMAGSTGSPPAPRPEPVEGRRGFFGIKIHPVLDHYAVESRALDEVFAVARAHRWPILTHADHDGTPMSAAAYEPLIRAYPDVILILAHLRLEAIPLAKRYDNVFVDTTYVDPVRVELGVDALGPDKILFGSDACEGFDVGRPVGRARPPRSYASLIAGLRERGISETALEKILYRNASRIFGIA